MKKIQLTNKSLKDFENLLNETKDKFNKEYEEKVPNDIEWTDGDTRENHCFNCCLFDSEKYKCLKPEICLRFKNTYKGFYQKKKDI